MRHALLIQEGSTIAFFAIVRREVLEPPHCKICLGTSPSATLPGRAALLNQEGVSLPESLG
jgi:hypothetical protein